MNHNLCVVGIETSDIQQNRINGIQYKWNWPQHRALWETVASIQIMFSHNHVSQCGAAMHVKCDAIFNYRLYCKLPRKCGSKNVKISQYLVKTWTRVRYLPF